MNYSNCIEPPGSGTTTNPRNQQIPRISHGMNYGHSGMNSGVGAGIGTGTGVATGAGAGMSYPVPVGYQSDLTFVMSMIEELSQILHTNQNLTAGVVDRMGKFREKAKGKKLDNGDLVSAVASEINKESNNIEKELSELRRALEETELERKENWKLAVYGANILADLTEKLHQFKELHEIDTLAWHKNYRTQLAAERDENLKLRCQVNDMKAAACQASKSLRDMRRFITDNNEWHELKIQNDALRKEKRYWKRLALPLIADDDSEWSDDDDLIDFEEKNRLVSRDIERGILE
ncbi:hypothetical protein GcC1_062014 [Golovinomyces cichoracearum]|uniref:Uncharacterized protein n=1 Tax=Golovinomyces cichoracearum TaxID=62708 RepID=A0A420ISS4_9PEZI|nr:hypothetical protein GcC1_062014 [Golovinomyces cichoracearum]